MKLKFVGEKYIGFDGHTFFQVARGQEVDLSEEKTKQLLQDFPLDWEKAKEEGTKEKDTFFPIKRKRGKK